MPRIALKVEYRGTRFHGSQFQAGVRTVQQELEQALGIFLRSPEERVKLIFSGRTDAGVHSRGQVVHFDTDEALDLWRLCWGINGILKDDLSVTAAQIAPPDFHARFSATRRTYVYRILNRPQRSALLKNDHWFIPSSLDLEAMQNGASMLVGDHDFAGFKSSNSDTSTTRCRVERAELLNLGEGKLEFWISANHFVYNMVRIIVGSLTQIGLGKQPISSLGLALSERQRQYSGPTAPSWGLCLELIEYPEAMQVFSGDFSRD